MKREQLAKVISELDDLCAIVLLFFLRETLQPCCILRISIRFRRASMNSGSTFGRSK